ncbi:hypothetical protein MBBAR_6c01390 [Methanobrevibacter arboriphilus JCM 13429 = DSM 1125]|uniref:Uncharacterized protein n=1 Tax=Methanobrevibacter arboriphilus JCM 13429 = DSM 1125 TaxID=1300164 RepID=A0A1V6N2Y0_METAZ|nr:DUF6882 domain-containing protein [Methanobrevibacter arboriphilus]OQD59029.1 hypothetical protein MBBAR_6c01390 [Methanobrevibacter arboriphilus JCM 13429 = DSM 1125]
MKEKAIKIEDSDSFQTIFTKYGAIALDKQECFGEIIGDTIGNLNIDDGVISFGDDLEFPVQIIGTLSNENNKWHWAWDNEEVNFTENLIKESFDVKKIGEKYSIGQFITDVFDADLLESHLIAMTVSGIMDDDAYYAVDLGEITIFVTIKSDKIQKDNSIERFINVYNKFQKEFDVKPRLAFEGYTKLRGYKYKERDEFSVAKIDESRVIVGFSERGNVTHIQTLLE